MKAIFYLLLSICSFSVLAQAENSHYIFPEFEKATIKFKQGNDVQALLNYNTLTEEMVFKQGENTMAMTEPFKIDAVYINGRKFIPEADSFREVVVFKKQTLYIRYKSTAIPAGVNTGMDDVSQTVGQAAMSNIRLLNGVYNLNLKDYAVSQHNQYFFKYAKGFQRISDAKSLDAFYPGRSAEIKKFIKDNKIDMKKEAELVKLIGFLEG